MNISHSGLSGPATRQRSQYLSTLSDVPLICFSHLRWSFVWQRPQHLMTRLAQAHPVFFVEEPILEETSTRPRLDVVPADGITILVPILPADEQYGAGFNARNNTVIQSLLEDYLAHRLRGPEVIAWYYTPMAFGALPTALSPSASIFDAMDELGSFRHAPAELKERERSLLRSVDLVFSGGPSLHDARKHLHPHAHCFPSGVDEEHFRNAGGIAPDDLPDGDAPIIGFYGVLDERVDFDLIARIADLRPDWSIVMIGPIVKITESELAHRPNIRYLGMRPYADLPRYLAEFDAAILPFALNEATRFISPTKTLEYLAAGKPVVSTPVHDVDRLYGEVVEIANTPENFVAAIELLWDEPEAEASMRRRLVHNLLARHHWDAIAAQMGSLIRDAVTARRAHAERARSGHAGVSSDLAAAVQASAD